MDGQIKKKGTEFLEISQDNSVLKIANGGGSYKFDNIKLNEFNKSEN